MLVDHFHLFRTTREVPIIYPRQTKGIATYHLVKLFMMLYEVVSTFRVCPKVTDQFFSVLTDNCTVEGYFYIRLGRAIDLLEPVDETLKHGFQAKASEQYFPVVDCLVCCIKVWSLL